MAALTAGGGHLLIPVSTHCWSAQPSLTLPWKIRNAYLCLFAWTLMWFSLASVNLLLKATNSVPVSDVNLAVS